MFMLATFFSIFNGLHGRKGQIPQFVNQFLVDELRKFLHHKIWFFGGCVEAVLDKIFFSIACNASCQDTTILPNTFYSIFNGLHGKNF